jgi:hypothetical protein
MSARVASVFIRGEDEAVLVRAHGCLNELRFVDDLAEVCEEGSEPRTLDVLQREEILEEVLAGLG